MTSFVIVETSKIWANLVIVITKTFSNFARKFKELIFGMATTSWRNILKVIFLSYFFPGGDILQYSFKMPLLDDREFHHYHAGDARLQM